MATRVTQEQEIIKRAREEIEKRTGKTPEKLYEEREKRIVDSIALKEPDRIPVTMRGVYFFTRYAGLPSSAVFYDPAAYKEALVKATGTGFSADPLPQLMSIASLKDGITHFKAFEGDVYVYHQLLAGHKCAVSIGTASIGTASIL